MVRGGGCESKGGGSSSVKGGGRSGSWGMVGWDLFRGVEGEMDADILLKYRGLTLHYACRLGTEAS